ncbi:ectoine utilization protein EutA [Phyllobacterium sp. YR531]|uniref:ectoine utilization protein EutA n=1 Tax=Phyllobacterium sp. YR531 TaxID=1144343 RepID=UPI00026FCBE7|nr:ectoine utilization protein EutA [Phyllobacterium sp. YR531]EJN04888.1 ectoine utilization protein EutA [Phyllobacterium sp. YR531]
MDAFPSIQQTNLPLEFDDRPLSKRVGLVILATDHTTEPDFQRMVASRNVGLYTSRIPYANPTTPENLRRMLRPMSEGAWMILPDEELDAICYSCTSASVVIGDEEVERALQQAKPNVPVVTPTRAAVKGLGAFGAKRISILTPYTIETSTPMAVYFNGKGFDIANFTCFGLDDDREMARISTQSLITAAREATARDADALFISCTALRAASVAGEIEQAIGKPVVTSNLATAWATLRICGEHSLRPELGSLMVQPMASW